MFLILQAPPPNILTQVKIGMPSSRSVLRKSRFKTSGVTLTPIWIEQENKLREHVLRTMSLWERNEDEFVLRDKKTGQIKDAQPLDNCAFIKVAQRNVLVS